MKDQNQTSLHFYQQVAYRLRQFAKSDPPEIRDQKVNWIKRLFTIILNYLDEETFCVEELARMMGVSRVHLYRITKKSSGLSPGALIRKIRLEKARQLLLMRYNVSETAYECGFRSISQFSKKFIRKNNSSVT